jgi:hypothetical protein
MRSAECIPPSRRDPCQGWCFAYSGREGAGVRHPRPFWDVPSGGCPSEGPTVAGRPEYVEEEGRSSRTWVGRRAAAFVASEIAMTPARLHARATRISVGNRRTANRAHGELPPALVQPSPAFFGRPPPLVTLQAQGERSLAKVECPSARGRLSLAHERPSLALVRRPRPRDGARVPKDDCPLRTDARPAPWFDDRDHGTAPACPKTTVPCARTRVPRLGSTTLHRDGVPCAKTTDNSEMRWIQGIRSRTPGVGVASARGERASRASAGSRRSRPSLLARLGKTLAQPSQVEVGGGRRKKEVDDAPQRLPLPEYAKRRPRAGPRRDGGRTRPTAAPPLHAPAARRLSTGRAASSRVTEVVVPAS